MRFLLVNKTYVSFGLLTTPANEQVMDGMSVLRTRSMLRLEITAPTVLARRQRHAHDQVCVVRDAVEPYVFRKHKVLRRGCILQSK